MSRRLAIAIVLVLVVAAVGAGVALTRERGTADTPEVHVVVAGSAE